MRQIGLTIILIMNSGCAQKSVQNRKIACVERFLDKNVDAEKGKNVCMWVFETQ